MKNPDHLLFFANVIASLFVGLTHLVTALNTLNNINIIFRHIASVSCAWQVGHFAPAIKRLRTAIFRYPLFKFIPAIQLASFLLHLALEDLLQLATRFPHAGDLRRIGMYRHQLAQHPHIQPAEMHLGALRLMRMHAQRDQRLAPQLQRTGERLTGEVFHTRLQNS
jgi:hypothetical protein